MLQPQQVFVADVELGLVGKLYQRFLADLRDCGVDLVEVVEDDVERRARRPAGPATLMSIRLRSRSPRTRTCSRRRRARRRPPAGRLVRQVAMRLDDEARDQARRQQVIGNRKRSASSGQLP